MARLFTPARCKGVTGRVLTSAWGQHPSFTALAVALEGGTVGFYQEEGDCLDARTVSKYPPSEVTTFAWCPTKPVLAIAWADGTLSIWSDASGTGVTNDDREVHSGKMVTVLQWSPDGSRLTSGDSSGRVSVRKVDPTGRLSTVVTYQRAGTITHCVYKPLAKSKSAAASIASGFSVTEQPPFFFANEGGAVSIADDMGHCNETVALGMPLAALLYYAAKEHLVVLTRSLVLAQYRTEPGGKMAQVMKVKLSVSGGPDVGITGCAWLTEGHLATVSSEAIVRVWDLANDDNYVLQLADEAGLLVGERALSLAFHPTKRLLAVGTHGGKIALWTLQAQRAPTGVIDDSSWRMLRPITALESACRSLHWSPNSHLLSAAGPDAVAICAESTLVRLVHEDWALVQLTAYAFALEHVGNGTTLQLATEMRTRGADLWGTRVLVWNGTRAEVHEVSPGVSPSVERVSSFHAPSLTLALHKDSVFLLTEGRLNIANLKGVIRSTLPFLEVEGPPVLIDVSRSTLCACTAKGVLRVWDISRNEPRQLAAGRTFDAPGAGPVTSIRMNPFGSAVSILTQPPLEPPGGRSRTTSAPAGGAAVAGAGASGERSSSVYVYQLETDAIQSYDFGGQGSVPLQHLWDATDPKLLGVLTEPSGAGSTVEGADTGAAQAARSASGSGLELTTLFASSDFGVRLQDAFGLPRHVESFLALHCPRIYFAGSPGTVASPMDAGGAAFDPSEPEPSAGSAAKSMADDIPFERLNALCRVTSRVMRDFAGIELPRGATLDGPVREALLSFSYQLTIGNMDEAYKAVRAIKSTSVWENMARMCVKTLRVDVAEVCLGNMSHARGAAAVREASVEPEPEARIAMLAIQLGLLEEAARLYTACGRHDLLNLMFQASGRWADAIALARDHDRIHIASTFHQYAKHLEAEGDVAGAINAFENAGTHLTNVPRVLFAAGKLTELKQYVDSSGHKELLSWWAKYCESAADFASALEYYERAGDQVARVRVLCFCDRLDEAAQIALACPEQAPAYHLARQYESRSMVREAIECFTRAGRYNQAARLAREHGFTSELQSLSLQAPAHMQEEAASFFEQRGQIDKAVQLYSKSGHTQRAVELCFRHELIPQLGEIARTLGPSTDPALLKRCGGFFLDHGQFDQAVHLLNLAGQHHAALELCVLHNLRISEEMAESMAPPSKLEDPTAEARRIETLLKIAKCCKRQGSYHLATKKYTQAGDKVKAMKCLLKSGDTEKIVFFAGVSRSREIFILGANYLQNLDWHSDPEIYRRIVEFYTKAKATDQLVQFHEACAALEVDDYRSYDKALEALREAVAVLERSRAQGREEKAASLQHRIALIERFVGARRVVKSDPQAMVDTCSALLGEVGVEGAIRIGDIFALMVEWFASQRDYTQAYAMIEKMRARGIVLSPYLDNELIETVCHAVGVAVEPEQSMSRGPSQSARPEGDAAEEEQIDDEIDEDD